MSTGDEQILHVEFWDSFTCDIILDTEYWDDNVHYYRSPWGFIPIWIKRKRNA